MIESKPMQIARLYNMNTPLYLIAQKYQLNVAEVINILHKFVVKG